MYQALTGLKLTAFAALLVFAGCDDGGGGSVDTVQDAKVFVSDGGDGGLDGDGGAGTTESHLRLSFRRRITAGVEQSVDLMMYDFEDDEVFNLTDQTDEVDCTTRQCSLTKDMRWLGWLTPDPAGGFKLFVAPVDVTLKKVQIDQKREVSGGVNRFEFAAELIVFTQGQAIGNDGEIDVVVEPIAGFEPDACPNDDDPAACRQIVGQIDGAGGFRVTPFGSLIIVIRTTLSNMTLSFFNVENGANQTLTTIGEQDGTGSQFSGLPVALSPDGKYIALFTRNEFIWRATTVQANPINPDVVVKDVFEAKKGAEQDWDCTREMPFHFNSISFDPRFSHDAEYFYALATGDCSLRTGASNRRDNDVLRFPRDLSGDPEIVNVTNTLRVNDWVNHEIGDFDVFTDPAAGHGSLLAFTAPRPGMFNQQSIWVINPDDGAYNCDRGSPIATIDPARERCEFIFEDRNGVDVGYRDVRFHQVEVRR